MKKSTVKPGIKSEITEKSFTTDDCSNIAGKKTMV